MSWGGLSHKLLGTGMTGYLRETKEVAKLRGRGHLAAFLLSELSLGGTGKRLGWAAAGSLSLRGGNSLLLLEPNPVLLVLLWG